MRKNNFGRFILVICIVLWALYEVYPPTSRDLVQEFSRRAENRDATFTNILTRVELLQKTGTNTEFACLQAAAATNDLQPYFPFISAKDQLYPNTFILNQLQRDASGRIKLGLDLQGGTSFLVEMDTNVLYQDTNAVQARADLTSAALSQAVEVLRKRIDRFGVAEPVIQSAGGNKILIQLPGLSPSDKESAKTQIQKTAYLEFRMVRDDSDEIIANHQPIPPGYVLLKHIEPQVGGAPPKVEQVVVSKKPVNGLAGDIVKSSMVVRGNLGEPQIDFMLSDDGAKKFAKTTREFVGHRMAIARR